MFDIFLNKVSFFQLIGLEAVGGTLVLASLAALLAPVFGGLELGGYKVPEPPQSKRKPFFVGGLLLFVVSVTGMLPMIADRGTLPPAQVEDGDMLGACQPIWLSNTLTASVISACAQAYQIRSAKIDAKIERLMSQPLPITMSFDLQLDAANLRGEAGHISEQLNRATNYCFQAGPQSFFADSDRCDFSRSRLKTSIVGYSALADKIENMHPE